MIRIAITPAAFDAVAATLPLCSVGPPSVGAKANAIEAGSKGGDAAARLPGSRRPEGGAAHPLPSALPRRFFRSESPFNFYRKCLILLARPKRFELLTPRFVVWCSIQLSYGRPNRAGGGQRAPRRLAAFPPAGKSKSPVPALCSRSSPNFPFPANVSS